jgi:hypothetical protein
MANLRVSEEGRAEDLLRTMRAAQRWLSIAKNLDEEREGIMVPRSVLARAVSRAMSSHLNSGEADHHPSRTAILTRPRTTAVPHSLVSDSSRKFS